MLPWRSLLKLFLVVLGVLASTAIGSASQASWQYTSSPARNHPWDSPSALGSQETYDHGLFTPLEYLSKLSEEKYTSLSHPLFPHYGVRIKKSNFCDGTVNAYTGYIDKEARHLFFYFFESRHDPAVDDVIFWTNGGPGCSSSVGLFMELGPCRVLDGDGPKYHPESWNSNANIFFIDQPIGVGFSFADHGETVSTTQEAAEDVAAFVAIFFDHFNQFKGRAFHMAGESYGGRYLPLFAAAVYDQNAKLAEMGLTPINLSSIMIGNGMTDAFSMMLSYYDMACTENPVPPILNIQTCVNMRKTLERSERWMKDACITSWDAINCAAVMSFATQMYMIPVLESGRSPHDITRKCNFNTQECYPERSYIASFLDKPSVRSTLGIDSSFTKNFTGCNQQLGQAFIFGGDMYHQTSDWVAALLERNIRVLVYVGSSDWICNWIGNERWTLAMDWSGKEEFNKQSLRQWMVDGKAAGVTRTFGNFTFATIDGAGHYVPYDKPRESLEMVRRWLAVEAL